MPLRTKLMVFAVVLVLLFTGLSVGTYLNLFSAARRADVAQDQLTKLTLVDALQAHCAGLTAEPDDLTLKRSRRTLEALRELDWEPEGRVLLDRVLTVADPIFTGAPLGNHEEIGAAVGELRNELLLRANEELRKADAPNHARAVRLLVASCLLAIGGSASFAWLAHRLVRERKALEERLHRSEKLAALGTLAAGIAHEINNPLATISMSAEALARRLPDSDRDVEYCQAIQDEAARCRDIIGDLSDLARGGAVDHEPVDPRELSRDALRIVRRNASLPAARVSAEVPDGLPLLSADRGKLLQVLVNLLQNGIEAAGPHGEVKLRAELLEGRLSLAVSDNGKGIPTPLLDRIFDPFYSDKDHGVGLGLTLCHRIAELHGGELTVASPGPDLGSTFTLVLPLEARDVA